MSDLFGNHILLVFAQGGSNLHIVQDDELGLRVYREWRDVINEEYDWELVCQ